jgi:penicillin-binding protein 2
VHALVSYPEYDPNILSKGSPSDVIAGYSVDTRQPYLDRAIAGLYAPGSIVKPMEAAAAISDGIITPERTIFSAGSISIPNPYDASKPSIFKDWKAHGSVDARRAIAVSSDIYFYAVSGGLDQQNQAGMGIERLAHWFSAFGFTSPTGIELSGEASGRVPTPAWKEETFGDPWRLGDTYNTSIGQYGMQVTALEAVRATAAVANGGKLMRPTILKDQPLSGETIDISRDALRVAREGMRMGVTSGGTAAAFNALSFTSFSGKTGTAQVGANNEYYNMWATGFWPYEKPKYAFVVLMDRGPAGTSVGAVSAAFQALQELNRTAPEYFSGTAQ